MNKQIEALKLALEGLEKWHFDKDPRGAADYIAAIHDALAENAPKEGEQMKNNAAMEDHWSNNPRFKEALAEQPAQQQEPVANLTIEDGRVAVAAKILPDGVYDLYTSPPAQQEPVIDKSAAIRIATALGWAPRKPWVGLTDEEVDECYYWKGRQWTTDELVRHVEAKLREKNA